MAQTYFVHARQGDGQIAERNIRSTLSENNLLYEENAGAYKLPIKAIHLKMRQMGWIGSAILLVAPKWLPGFLFFQLSLVPISH